MSFIKFVLYLPEWVSGDKNLCSTLNGQVKKKKKITQQNNK